MIKFLAILFIGILLYLFLKVLPHYLQPIRCRIFGHDWRRVSNIKYSITKKNY